MRIVNAWVNFDDVIDQLVAHGFEEPRLGWSAGIDGAGKGSAGRVKTKVEGRSQKGWYALHTIRLDDGRDALVGAFGWWEGGDAIKHKIKLNVDGKSPTLSPEQRAAIKAQQAAAAKIAEAKEQARNDRAARQAMHTWSKCSPDGKSPYLERKGVGAFGVKFSPSGALAVPMADTHGRIHGLQFIRPAKSNGRDKEFWPVGLAMKGHFHQIGRPDGLCLVAEGYATAASLHMATGLPVVVAFTAGNLMPVAQAIAKKYRSQILICADDDYLQKCRECNAPTVVAEPVCAHCGKEHRATNPGVTAASNTALAVNGAWVAPVFAADRAGQKITDFNDLHEREGLGAVRAQVEARLAALGWAAPAAPRADVAPEGGGGKRKAAQSVMELDALIERFVPLDDGTGDYVFDTWTNKVAKKGQMIALLPAGVRGDDIKRHPVWYRRGAYYLDQVGFDPSGRDANCKLNTWQGWPMKPVVGKCERLLELLRYLCSGESEEKAGEVFSWLLCWMAYPLQNPGAKMSSAVIMHGPQGTGKSTVFQSLAKIYGDYSTVLNQRGLEDKFNSDWSDSKLFILAEEVVTRAEMWHIKNELKELVTGEWIRINPKNIAAYRQRNQVNICYLSNEGQPLPIDNDDRRHLVVYTPPALTEQYYDEVFLEIEQGGVEALYHHLLELDLTGFHPKKRPPMTEAKQRLMALSSPSEVRFATDYITGVLDLPICPCFAADFYAVYLKWCRANGEARPRASNHFHGAINHLSGWAKRDARVFPNDEATETKVKAVIFPPDKAVADDGNEMPPGAKVARWLTDCVNKFAEASKNTEGARWAA